jgi:hypothetical protein
MVFAHLQQLHNLPEHMLPRLHLPNVVFVVPRSSTAHRPLLLLLLLLLHLAMHLSLHLWLLRVV